MRNQAERRRSNRHRMDWLIQFSVNIGTALSWELSLTESLSTRLINGATILFHSSEGAFRLGARVSCKRSVTVHTSSPLPIRAPERAQCQRSPRCTHSRETIPSPNADPNRARAIVQAGAQRARTKAVVFGMWV